MSDDPHGATDEIRALAVVTGASSGIGYELARHCAEAGYDLIVVADEPEIEAAAEALRAGGVEVEALEADLATPQGVGMLLETIGERAVDALLANAGRGLGDAFLDQEFEDVMRVIDTNITGTLLATHRIAAGMRERGWGRILFTGSIAGFIPGSYQAVYNASKAFIDSFAAALRDELRDSGVTVTCLMPGPTDTRFFERAGMTGTYLGQEAAKDDPAHVARQGFEAMMNGEASVVTGMSNKLQAAMAHLLPSGMLAQMHRRMAEPGSG